MNKHHRPFRNRVERPDDDQTLDELTRLTT